MAATHASATSFLSLLLLCTLATFPRVCRSDPDPIDDVCIADLTSGIRFGGGFPCKASSQVTADDFVFDGLRNPGNTSNVFGAETTFGTVNEFPGLNTLGLSMNRVDFAPGGVNQIHTHPRSSELVAVIRGKLLIGILTTDNTLFTRVVEKGEVFVVPRGLMHFQVNVGKGPAQTLAAFNSQNPGGISVAKNMFASKPAVPDVVLTKVFQIDAKAVDAARARFGAVV